MADSDTLGNNKNEEQIVQLSLSQYTDWMLKAHTLMEIKKLTQEIDDDETLASAICALLR